MLTKEEKNRYARHLSLPGFGEEAQLRLKAAKIAVIGAGGLGCPALQYLVAAGVGNITVIDGDTVSISNLQRQVLFTPDDEGRSKAEMAANKLQVQNPHIKITPLPYFLSKENALENLEGNDLIIDGSDNFGTRYLVNDASVILGIPMVFGSIYKFEGQVSVFNYKGGPTYRCLFPEPPAEGEMPSCAEIGVLGILPGIVGCMQANEAIKIITETGDPLNGKLLMYDALTNEQRILKVKANPQNQDILTLGEYSINCGSIMNDEISKEELKELLSQDAVYLIDVREPHEHEEHNIGGKNFPLSRLTHHLTEIPSDKEIILHCQSGGRSAMGVELLRQNGFDNVRHLRGGLAEW